MAQTGERLTRGTAKSRWAIPLTFLAVLGFAVIAGVAAVLLVLLLAFRAKRWILGFFRRDTEPTPRIGGCISSSSPCRFRAG